MKDIVVDNWLDAAESWRIGRDLDDPETAPMLPTFQGEALREAGMVLLAELEATRIALAGANARIAELEEQLEEYEGSDPDGD